MEEARKWLLLGACAMGVVWPLVAAPEEYRADTLVVDRAFARATPPGARTGAVYFTVDNAGNSADRLLRASTPVAAGVVLHQMAMEDGVMKMRAIPSVEIRPGARLELAPDGYHLMLIDLKQPLKVGEQFPLMLTFERAGTIRTMVVVEEMAATRRH
jgi:periplasmic copper chaperone A